MGSADDAVKVIVREKAARSIGALFHPRTESLSSCLFLQDRDDYFVVTASHCFPKPDLADDVLIATAQQPIAAPLDHTDRTWFTSPEGKDPDITVLAITPRVAARLEVEWQTRDSCSSVVAVPEQPVCVAGFPGQLIHVEGSKPRLIGAPPLLVLSKVVPDPTGAVDPPWHAAAEVAVSYPAGLTPGASAASNAGVHPSGMSGCPVFWIPRAFSVEGPIWSARDIKVAGVQSAYFRGLGLLRVKRIEHAWALIDRRRKCAA